MTRTGELLVTYAQAFRDFADALEAVGKDPSDANVDRLVKVGETLPDKGLYRRQVRSIKAAERLH